MKNRSDREMLKLSIRNEFNDISAPSRKTAVADCGDVGPEYPPSLGCALEVYRSLVHDFWDLTCNPSKASTRLDMQAPMTISAQAVLPLAFRNQALDAALFAVSTMYLGRLNRDAKLRRLALAAYPNALNRFHSELVLLSGIKSEQRCQVSAVSIATSLLFFEVSFSWIRNVTGDKEILLISTRF